LLVNGGATSETGRRVFSPEVASLIGNILSDPEARRLEFGQGSLLRFPIQTAVKTGTSSDYRDAWALGYNYRYTVGVWMGNLNSEALDGVTGSTGPALVLRSVFAELNRHQTTRSLYLSPRLVSADVCRDSGRAADSGCPRYSEWFLPGTQPHSGDFGRTEMTAVHLRRPTQGLQLALDPRIPDDQEAFAFELTKLPEGASVDWFVDDRWVGSTSGGDFLWPLQRGDHVVKARIRGSASGPPSETPAVSFVVR
ncbi:MAG: hypothetical protein JSW39_15560, partial [Desulfobacterales bacterium]